jgi:hypothetical protein
MRNMVLLCMLLASAQAGGVEPSDYAVASLTQHSHAVKRAVRNRTPEWKKLLHRVTIQHGLRLYYYPGEIIGSLRTSTNTKIGDGRAYLATDTSGIIYAKFQINF